MKETRVRKARITRDERITAIDNTMRQVILDLVSQGINTAPELARVLGEDRTNLYHHLKLLENNGYIEGYFTTDSTKRYRVSNRPEILEEDIIEGIIETRNIVILPGENRERYEQKIAELLELAGIEHGNEFEIRQVSLQLLSKKSMNRIADNINNIRVKIPEEYHENTEIITEAEDND